MVFLDWVVIAGYFVVTIMVGLMFSGRAGKSIEEFFLAGRALPWWMAGGSMVATMFASDTPLFHCGNVREAGLSAGWLFLFPMFGAMLAAAVFAPLVRRTQVITDAEFIELRYSGRTPGPFRAFLAVYFGLFVAALTMGWVTKGMQQIIATVMGYTDPVQQMWSVIVLLGVVTLYSMASGMWGVVMTDMFQYLIATAGSLYLAYAAIHACGGTEGLRQGLAAVQGYSGSDLHFFPNGKEIVRSSGELILSLPLALGWIIVYGASQASSAAHQGQRVLACKSERDASLTYVFYSVCYYALNGLPWFITGLASVLVLGATNQDAGIRESEQAFPAMIKQLMPKGLLGLMVASLFAAFMSTVSVLLNWGGSYLVNDVYKRYLNPRAEQSQLVWVARLASLFIAIFGGVLCLQFSSLAEIMLTVPPLLTGAVMVYLVRWLWWRTNIWSEIAAYVASPVIGAYVQFVMAGNTPDGLLSFLPGYGIWATPEGLKGWETFGQRLLLPMIGTTLVFFVVTLLTSPTESAKLEEFYRRVRPPGPGWRHVRERMTDPPHVESICALLAVWGSGVLGLLGVLLTVVTWLQGRTVWPFLWALAGVAGFTAMGFLLRKVYPNGS